MLSAASCRSVVQHPEISWPLYRHEGMKRGGAGKGNWGVEGEETEEAAAAPAEAYDGAVEAAEGVEDDAEVAPEPEPEVREPYPLLSVAVATSRCIVPPVTAE